MTKKLLSILALGALLVTNFPIVASANIIQAVVSGNAQPWNPILNSNFAYGVNDGIVATIIDANDGISFNTGDSITVTYLNGSVRAGGGWPWVDANGSGVANGSSGSSGRFFPSKYMSSYWNTNLMALVGTFADSSGVIVGTPFEVGNGPTTFTIPSGASRLQLGINDDKFYNNPGSFTVEISSSPVPEPSTMFLFGFGLVGLIAYRKRTGI